MISLWNIFAKLETIHANQKLMIGLLQSLGAKESQMAIDLTALTNQVAANNSLIDSVIMILKAIPPSSDPQTQAAIDQLTAALTTSDSALAAAIPANTPAAPAAPSS